MGCNSSQIHIEQPSKFVHLSQIQSQIVLEHEKREQVQTPQSVSLKAKQKIEKQDFKQWCFLFGETTTERKIVCFDIKQLQFSTISSRTKIPEPVLKYQPIEVIYEESQQLFSSALFTKNSHPPYNFMLALWLDSRRVFVCGGVTFDFDCVSSESYIFDTKTLTSSELLTPNRLGNNLMGTKFEKLPFMSEKRYSHMGVIYTIGLLKYVYVFGGRGPNDQLLNSCERYSILEKKWTKIAPMKTARSTGFSFVYRDRIYIVGGYSGKPKRTKKIEVYYPEKDYWQVLSVKMHRGLETGLLFSVKPNELLFVGGNLQYGSTNSVVEVNLENQTYIAAESLNYSRVLSKGCITNKDIIVFGGSLSDGLQIYNYKGGENNKWQQNPSCLFSGHIKTQEINSFSYSIQTVEVQYQQEVGSDTHKVVPNIADQRALVFSHDSYPLILDINFTANSVTKKAVPMTLRLRSHMSCVLLKPGKYFIAGGVSEFYQKAAKSSYIYYLTSNRAIEQPKMITPRYKFAMCFYNDSIYAFGGKILEQEEPIWQCQKFSLEQNAWIQIAPLSIGRCSATAVVVKNRICILGGSNGVRDLEQIQLYNPETNLTVLLDTNSKLIPNILTFKCGQDILVFGGNYESELTNTNIYKVELIENDVSNQIQSQYVSPVKGEKQPSTKELLQQSQQQSKVIQPTFLNQQSENIEIQKAKISSQSSSEKPNEQINSDKQDEVNKRQQIEEQQKVQYTPFTLSPGVKVEFQETQYQVPSTKACISTASSVYLVSSNNYIFKWNNGILQQIKLNNSELLGEIDWNRVSIV